MSAAPDIDRATLGTPGDLLGSGSQARVHDLPDLRLPDVHGALVFKEYKPGNAPAAGARGVVGLRLGLDSTRRDRLDALAAWPVRAVTAAGAVVGLVLPRIPEGYFADLTLPSGTVVRLPREIQHLFPAPGRTARSGLAVPTVEQRLALCRAAAAALAFLHDELDVVYGDLNARNLLYRLDPEPAVMFVDCDAVRVRGSAATVRQLHAEDWTPPEDDAPQSVGTDRYKLGLFVLRCLSPGPGCSVNRDPTAVVDVLDGPGRDLLDRALGADPGARPTAQQWVRHLSAMLGEDVEPPRVEVPVVDRTLVPPGSEVRVSWVARDARSVEILVPGGSPVVPDATSGRGTVAVVPGRSGTITVLAHNSAGTTSAHTEPVAVLDMPEFSDLPVPLPRLSWPVSPPDPTMPPPGTFPQVALAPLPALPALPVLVPAAADAEWVPLPPDLLDCPIDVVSLMIAGPAPTGPDRGWVSR